MHEPRVDSRALLRVRDFGMKLHAVEAARFVGHAGERQIAVEAINLNPGGSFVTRSPCLIHTSSTPWPFALIAISISRSSWEWPCARSSA